MVNFVLLLVNKLGSVVLGSIIGLDGIVFLKLCETIFIGNN